MNTSKVNNVRKQTRVYFFIPKRPEYKELEARMASFERRSWPPSIPIKPRILAEAGFYYTGKILTSFRNSRVFFTFKCINS